MSHYFEWGKEDPTVGYDIDKQKFRHNNMDFGDYDELVTAHLSGGSHIIPHGTKGEYESNLVNGERVYNLKSMLAGDQKGFLSNMVDISNNGRVRDVTKHDTPKVPTANLPPVGLVMHADNTETAIKGLLEKNAVNDILFSTENIKGLQQGIKYGVYQRTKKRISDQSPNELYIIIRSIMLQHANFQTSADAVVEEVRRLNTKVLIYCIENVSSNVLQKVQYLKDLETLPIPIDHPTHASKPQNYSYDISNIMR